MGVKMHIEIISIGNELLTGKTVNGNAAHIAKKLLEQGFSIKYVHSLPDDKTLLNEAITTICNRSDLVIITGGLGPTKDDLTREIVAKVFRRKLETCEDLKDDLHKRFPTLSSLDNQSMIVEGSELFENKMGTAPGFFLTDTHKSVVALPGVPSQMQAILEVEVIPFLEMKYPMKQRQYFHEMHLYLLNENTLDPLLRSWEEKYPEIEVGICPSYGTLSLYFQAPADSKNAAMERFNPLCKEVEKQFGTFVYASSDKSLSQALQEEVIQKKESLVLAESCTGGSISSAITKNAGCSEFFLGSLVTYCDELKKEFLKVPKQVLDSDGAVSEACVIQMLEGLFTNSSASIAASVSGIAGPGGGTEGKPAGTIFAAIGKRSEKPLALQLTSFGIKSRAVNIEYATNVVLAYLHRYLKHGLLERVDL